MLDYSYYRSLSLTLTSPVDSINLTSCLKSISWGLSAHEPGASLTYEGSLSIALSAQAEAEGLTVDSFDQQLHPSLWLPGTAVLTLTLGATVLKFRLADCRFDGETKTGSAKVTQQLRMYNVSIPDADKAFPVTPYNESVTNVIYRAAAVTNNWANDPIGVGSLDIYPRPKLNLLGQPIDGSALGSVNTLGFGTFTDTPTVEGNGTVYGQRSSSNLWSDSQNLLTHTWAWLHQSLTNELVNASHLSYTDCPLLLVRPYSQAQVKNENSLSQTSPRIIAHGSADLPDPDECNVPAEVKENSYPPSNTEEGKQLLSAAMPELWPAEGGFFNDREEVTTRKVIDFSYMTPAKTKVETKPGVSHFITTVLEWAPENEYPLDENSMLWKTVTTNYKCEGMVFPGSFDPEADRFNGRLYSSSRLIPYERITETYRERITEKCEGLITPVFPTGRANAGEPNYSTWIMEFKREKLRDKPIDVGCGKDAEGNVVKTTFVKTKPVRTVNKPLVTASFKSEVALVRSYRPALDFPYVFDIGWCPNTSSANLVASCVIVRERSRSNTDQIQMPLPHELIDAGCPVFFRLAVGNKLYFADGPQYKIEVDAIGKVRAGVSLTGCVLGNVTPIPEPVAPPLFFGSSDLAVLELAHYSTTLYAKVGVAL